MMSEVPLITTRFGDNMESYNGLAGLGFDRWAFYPGMLFAARNKWWGNRGKRDKPHEGLDICLFMDVRGQLCDLAERTRIPVICEGEIVKVADDYLGMSVYVGHDIYDGKGNRLYSIYGHTAIYGDISRGRVLNDGDLVATVAPVRGAGVLPHLHISIAWIPENLPHERLDWETIGDPNTVTLLDPLEIIACKYTVL